MRTKTGTGSVREVRTMSAEGAQGSIAAESCAADLEQQTKTNYEPGDRTDWPWSDISSTHFPGSASVNGVVDASPPRPSPPAADIATAAVFVPGSSPAAVNVDGGSAVFVPKPRFFGRPSACTSAPRAFCRHPRSHRSTESQRCPAVRPAGREATRPVKDRCSFAGSYNRKIQGGAGYFR